MAVDPRGWRGFALVMLVLAVLGCSTLMPSGTEVPPPAPTRVGDAGGASTAPPDVTPAPTVTPGGPVVPAESHPRLWITAADLPRLRAWATDDNPLWRDGLLPLAQQARADMDSGLVPGEDDGGDNWVEYPTEMYAQLFAFMSQVAPDPAERDDYGRRARDLLMYVINLAAQGPADERPFRDPGFATSDSDRSRWWGDGFPTAADWAYAYLSAEDKAAIRSVFLRWSRELITDSYQRPEPEGVINDPVLLSDPILVRWSGNNYYTAHMRNLGLMALALDPADDPGGELRGQLDNATGAWLYVVDQLLRLDARGGLGIEGFEYSPQALGYVAQFLLALHTAGQDDSSLAGPHVVLANNPFWEEALPAFFASLSPATAPAEDAGDSYQPAFYGDGQVYQLPDFIEMLGPLGVYDAAAGAAARLNAVRWAQVFAAPGGQAAWLERVRGADTFSAAIWYFLLFDPAAPPPDDPRPALPVDLYVAGIQRVLARTDWTPQAAWFTYKLGWNSVDHQHGDGNMIEFYRQGEWLTKERTGYSISSSDYHNTLALENDPPEHNERDDYRYELGQRGSQWLYDPVADGQVVARSFGDGYVYVTGDATGLYNSEYESSTDILHASRSVVWLKPDVIVVYDRAASQTAGRFKRFWLNFPADGHVSGRLTTMTTAAGQQLFVSTLLPEDADIRVEPFEPLDDVGGSAVGEMMQYRLRVEAPGGPTSTRFLHVLQGADAGAAPETTQLLASAGGPAYAGVQVGQTSVWFAVDLGPAPASLTLRQPSAARILVTGLVPGAGYSVAQDGETLTITSGGSTLADSGGVLVIND